MPTDKGVSINYLTLLWGSRAESHLIYFGERGVSENIIIFIIFFLWRNRINLLMDVSQHSYPTMHSKPYLFICFT